MVEKVAKQHLWVQMARQMAGVTHYRHVMLGEPITDRKVRARESALAVTRLVKITTWNFRVARMTGNLPRTEKPLVLQTPIVAHSGCPSRAGNKFWILHCFTL